MSIDLDQAKQRDLGRGHRIQRDRLVVWDFYQGTGTHSEIFPHEMREIVFSNDSLTDNIEVQIIGPADLNVTIVLLPNEVIDERFAPFTSISITGAGAWRFYPRSSFVP